MVVFLKALLLFLVLYNAGAKQINITVMVPGISAFKNLANITWKSSQKNFLVETDLFEEKGKENDYDYPYSYYESDALYQLTDRKIIQKCFEPNKKLLDIICAHDWGEFVTYPWSYIFVKPALDVALKKIQQTNDLLDGYEINLIFYDSGDEKGKTSERRAQIASVDSMMKDNMAAMIGPVNNYAMTRVLTFTSHWKILHLTPGADSAVLRCEVPNVLKDLNKKEKVQNTMVRTGPIAMQVGRCVSAILKAYNWTTTALQLFGDDPKERHHYFISEGIFAVLRKDPPDFQLNYERITEYSDASADNEELLELIKLQARVILISMDIDQLLQFLVQAYRYGFDEEFVFIIVDLKDKLGSTPWKFADDEKKSEGLKQLFRSSIVITLEKTATDDYKKFVKNLKRNMGRKLDGGFSEKIGRDVTRSIIENERRIYGARSVENLFEKNQYPAFFHDSLITLAHVLNNTLSRDLTTNATEVNKNPKKNPSAAELLEKLIANHTFEGVTGKMSFDQEGDRKINFHTLRYDPKKDKMKIVGQYDGNTNIYKEHIKVPWPLGVAPPDLPVCGFDESKCDIQNWTLIKVLATGFSFVIMVALIVFICKIRQEKLKKELESQLWKVSWSDISCTMKTKYLMGDCLVDNRWMGEAKVLSETEPSMGEVISYYVPSFSPSINAKRAMKRKRKWSSNSRKNEKIFDDERKSSIGSLISDKVWGGYTTLGLYKDKTVVIKFSNRRKIELSRKVLMELKHMRDITHEHLTRFEGACVDSPHVCVLTEYCGKGSLKEILLNDEIRMDWMFRVSLMNDLVKGMSFLHNSAIQYHGNLKSTNCVVDSRFVLKITDYGLHSFRNLPSADESYRECEKKLWTAPELLRRASNLPIASQKADVYSFGIILQEIALRKGPFYVESVTISCKEIISRVRGGCKPYFRPLLDTSTLSEDICNLMEKCWHEEPNERPDFTLTKKIIERFNRENPGNLVENLLHRMEQYAINLEGLVEERTAAYMEEKEKADELLYQMLPVPVVNRLKRGDSVPAEAFESVTICFTDIVGFTSLSAASSPMQIVDLLNDLYTCFDEIIENYDVYKVETIGDAYMLVSGLPVRNGIRHACEIARTALHLLKAVSNFKIKHRPGDQLKLRIGIHTGPCCAGVVGLKMPRYCLFGDTVNTASRLESSGLALAVHVSESTKQLLDKFKSFQLQLRGDVPLKGKGTVTTYWLLGEISTEFQSLDEIDNSA